MISRVLHATTTTMVIFDHNKRLVVFMGCHRAEGQKFKGQKYPARVIRKRTCSFVETTINKSGYKREDLSRVRDPAKRHHKQLPTESLLRKATRFSSRITTTGSRRRFLFFDVCLFWSFPGIGFVLIP